jgi:DNA-binding PadR family transcriptional regulator
MRQGGWPIVTERQLTQFEHILLGMICLQPSSGYDLKRRFAVTPLGVYQPSSGALYPALRRLVRMDLARDLVESKPGGESARSRRVYEPTQAGLTAHVDWLRAPVDPATVSRDLGLHLMRFVMMEHQLPRADALEFLQRLGDALAAFTAQLEQYAASGPDGFPHVRLALQHGLATHHASLRWVSDAIAELSAAGLSGAGLSAAGLSAADVPGTDLPGTDVPGTGVAGAEVPGGGPG